MFHLLLPLLFLFGSFMFIFVFAIMVFVVIKVITTYLFESLLLFSVSKKDNYNYPLVSFIPIINRLYLGKKADKKMVGMANILVEILLVLISVVSIVAKNNGVITQSNNLGMIYLVLGLSFIDFVLGIYLSHRIMENAIGKKASLFTVLSVITLDFSRPIVLFLIRKKV